MFLMKLTLTSTNIIKIFDTRKSFCNYFAKVINNFRNLGISLEV